MELRLEQFDKKSTQSINFEAYISYQKIKTSAVGVKNLDVNFSHFFIQARHSRASLLSS